MINLSTTKTVEEIARRYGVSCKRTKVGEINVVEEMRRRETRIGGDGNGGVISPEIHLGRDSLAGIGYVLEMMARRKSTLSGLVADLPQYVMRKGKVSLEGAGDSKGRLRQIQESFRGERTTDIDGLRIDFTKDARFRGGWVHLRSSNTEPIFRIISEGRDKKQADLIYNHFAGLFK